MKMHSFSIYDKSHTQIWDNQSQKKKTKQIKI